MKTIFSLVFCMFQMPPRAILLRLIFKSQNATNVHAFFTEKIWIISFDSKCKCFGFGIEIYVFTFEYAGNLICSKKQRKKKTFHVFFYCKFCCSVGVRKQLIGTCHRLSDQHLRSQILKDWFFFSRTHRTVCK